MSASPKWPPALGYGGLVPFWILALARVTGSHPGLGQAFVTAALATYGATILSFLGGIRWGIFVARPDATGRDLLVSVVPQLLGWAALALADPWRLVVLALLILGLGPLDRGLVRRGLAPDWFGRLRMRLSLGAGAALLLAAMA